MNRIAFTEVHEALTHALLPMGFTAERAALCAQLFAETTRDGVYTHGLARFPRFIAMVRNGAVDPVAESVLVNAMGGLERWDGRQGPGNLNASAAMARAMMLANEHGLGAVALARTNHWMRGGSYGWQAAESGCFGMCWTNTLANLPPWGSSEPLIGNNPLVLAVPRAGGQHVVLDMAMSQYSFGTLSAYKSRGQQLPFPGGFNKAGELTTDPAEIEVSGRALPVGMWKGSGLSIVLDLMAAMLSGGNATWQLETTPERETGLSQIFIAVAGGSSNNIADGVIASLKGARYPGEETLRIREENLRLGLPVDEALWKQITNA